MKVVHTHAGLHEALGAARRREAGVGFVPTMGALHAGHLALVAAARRECDAVVVSIFVNPLQFGPQEDFAAYPRDTVRDAELLEGAGTDVLFSPAVEEMFPPGHSTSVDPGPLGEVLEGEMRPGHFRGVCTVVAKLFNAVGPRRAYFGQKDAQQVAVVRQMVRDLSFPIEICVVPTVRDEDGLALSSRNAYLDEDQRARATVLYRALVAGRDALSQGTRAAEKAMQEALAAEPAARPDYAVAVDPDTFGEPGPRGPVLLAVAARLGPARLIDNLLVDEV